MRRILPWGGRALLVAGAAGGLALCGAALAPVCAQPSGSAPLSPPVPREESVELAPLTHAAPPPTGDVQTFDIDLPTALRLVNETNPTIALARERINQAYYVWKQARALWLPDLQAVGINYQRYDGQLFVNGVKIVTTSNATISNYGAGVLNLETSEALFAPLVARQRTSAATAAARATTNDVQLQTALAYLDLLQVYGLLAVNADTLARAEEMLRNAEAAAEAGKSTTAADVQRARTEVDLRRVERVNLEGQLGVVSSQLAQLLLLDPTIDLRPLEPAIVPIVLVPDCVPLEELVAIGLMNRPELAEERSLVQAALVAWRQAKCKPLFPILQYNYSGGGLGGGPNNIVSNYNGTAIGSMIVTWQLDNCGAGNIAQAKERRSLYNQARFQLVQTQAEVAQQVVAAAKDARARLRSLEAAQNAVRQASEMWRRLRESAFGLVGGDRKYDPLQPLIAEQQLAQVRQTYLQQVIEFNKSQFRLYYALGKPPEEALGSAVPVQVEVPAAPPPYRPQPLGAILDQPRPVPPDHKP